MPQAKPDPDNNLGRGAPYDREERVQRQSKEQGVIEFTKEFANQRIDHHWLEKAEAQLENCRCATLPAACLKELIALARHSLGARRVGPEEEKRESTF